MEVSEDKATIKWNHNKIWTNNWKYNYPWG